MHFDGSNFDRMIGRLASTVPCLYRSTIELLVAFDQCTDIVSCGSSVLPMSQWHWAHLVLFMCWFPASSAVNRHAAFVSFLVRLALCSWSVSLLTGEHSLWFVVLTTKSTLLAPLIYICGRTLPIAVRFISRPVTCHIIKLLCVYLNPSYRLLCSCHRLLGTICH